MTEESQGARVGVDPIRVLIADDYALFRRGLELVLKEVAPSAVRHQPGAAQQPSLAVVPFAGHRARFAHVDGQDGDSAEDLTGDGRSDPQR